MKLSSINALCSKIGKSKYTSDKDWKCLKYIDLNIEDIQEMLKNDKVTLNDSNETIVFNDVGITDVVALDKVHAVSVSVDNNGLVDIYDLINKISDTPIAIPVTFSFMCNGIYIPNNGGVIHDHNDGTMDIKIGMTRPLKTPDDYIVEKRNSDGEIVENFDEPGEYTLTVKVVNTDYVGEGLLNIVITPIVETEEPIEPDEP